MKEKELEEQEDKKIDETNFYDDKEIEELRKNDGIDLKEEAFMKGYLQADEEYEEQ